jgi:hypothetical protein
VARIWVPSTFQPARRANKINPKPIKISGHIVRHSIQLNTPALAASRMTPSATSTTPVERG